MHFDTHNLCPENFLHLLVPVHPNVVLKIYDILLIYVLNNNSETQYYWNRNSISHADVTDWKIQFETANLSYLRQTSYQKKILEKVFVNGLGELLDDL